MAAVRGWAGQAEQGSALPPLALSVPPPSGAHGSGELRVVLFFLFISAGSYKICRKMQKNAKNANQILLGL